MSNSVEQIVQIEQTDLRSPEQVMRLERMGSFFPTRLSFMRVLLRKLAGEKAKVHQRIWSMDDHGFGHAVYEISFGGFDYSLVAFSNKLEAEKRTDRVIAEAWDTSFVLYDGKPDQAEIERLSNNAPLQEAGRFSSNDLILSRANKSVRLFSHIVDCLSAGKQPDLELVRSTGYLMRTTAVYGNGKFGIADRSQICERDGLSAPFQAEMLLVWLVRGFTHDLVEHVARQKGGDKFVPLDRNIKNFLGVGNSTGLGMAPFLVSHPMLINNWMMVRETALARVRAIKSLDDLAIAHISRLIERVSIHLQQWNVDDERQMERINVLRDEWMDLSKLLTPAFLQTDYAVEQLFNASAQWSIECQELIVSLVVEPQGDLVDGLSECMDSSGEQRLNPIMKLGELSKLLNSNYKWALKTDLSKPSASRQFWYVSEEKLEPRLGDRYSEEGADLEQPFDIAHRCQALQKDLEMLSKHQSVAEFLISNPQHRYIVRRVQLSKQYPYSEIKDNLIADTCLPIDMLRCKLSFFGACKFDPKSDRWTRIALYQGAPLFGDLEQSDFDDWWLPILSGCDSKHGLETVG